MQVECASFLTKFFKLGFEQRAALHHEQVLKQRNEDARQHQDHLRRVVERGVEMEVKMTATYSENDMKSVMTKLLTASVGYDRYHPASPSLAAFEGALMGPAEFRENLRKTFNLHVTNRELAYLMDKYGSSMRKGMVSSSEFLTHFLSLGFKERNKRRVDSLEKQREAMKKAKEEEEKKLEALASKSDVVVDWNFSMEDRQFALDKITVAAAKFDKFHPAAPSVKSFEGGPLTAGVYREAMRRTFNVWLTPRELAAMMKEFAFNDDESLELLDPKRFMVSFLRMGVSARDKAKILALQEQKRIQAEERQEAERKKRLATQKMVVDIDEDFGAVDRASAIEKFTAASAKYDKNAPGCVSLDVFMVSKMTPAEFREAVKNTFRIVLLPKELSAMVKEFDKDASGNVSCSDFVVSFIRYGSEERARIRALQLEKQRKDELHRRTEHERKVKEAESKMVVDIRYDYSEKDEASAFEKLASAAKKVMHLFI